MGAIYEVRNMRLGRSFALKTLIGEAAEDDEVLQRFRREADVIARIKHPNIVEVIDWDTLEDGSPCIVLEFLNGEDLAARIKETAPMPWPLIARIGDQILNGLSTAHNCGIIHRDLKPQNVFLALDDSGEERVKLLDFGVSKIRDSRSLVTTDARLLGTPSYMSPEQAEGRHEDIGPTADVWAVGAILYEMATGSLVFDAPSMPSVLYKICHRDADSVDLRRPDAPAGFVETVRDALTRDIAQRIGDADVFRVRLREALRDVPGVTFSDVMPAVRLTPLPRSTPTPSPTALAPTPRRAKRYTGAHADTVTSGNLMPVPQLTPTSGQISGSTLPPRRKHGALIALLGTTTVAMIVAVVVMASRRDAQPAAASDALAPRPEPAPIVQKPVEPVIVDAAAVVETVDAAPAPKPTVKKQPAPVKPEVKVEPVKPEPVKPTKKCAKDDPMCAFGTDQ